METNSVTIKHQVLDMVIFFPRLPPEVAARLESREGSIVREDGTPSELRRVGYGFGTSLVVPWLRTCLPMQGTWVRSLFWEDSTCHRATKPAHLNYWACALEPGRHNRWAHVLQLLSPCILEPVLPNQRSPHNEKTAHCNLRVAPTPCN